MYISEAVRASAKCLGIICRFLHFPVTDAIATIALRNLDLPLEGNKFEQFYVSETVCASTEMCGDTCRFLKFAIEWYNCE